MAAGGVRPNAGRKGSIADPVMVSLKLEREVVDVIDAMAVERGESRAETIRKAIDFYLDAKLKKEKQDV